MYTRSRAFMKDTVDILRAALAVDVTTIRDRIITGYTTIQSSVPCYIEAAGSELIADAQLGMVPVDRFSVYFPIAATVQVGDIIKDGTTYYKVLGVMNFSAHDFHKRIDAIQQNYFQNQ